MLICGLVLTGAAVIAGFIVAIIIIRTPDFPGFD
jgi:hypothetical protein